MLLSSNDSEEATYDWFGLVRFCQLFFLVFCHACVIMVVYIANEVMDDGFIYMDMEIYRKLTALPSDDSDSP